MYQESSFSAPSPLTRSNHRHDILISNPPKNPAAAAAALEFLARSNVEIEQLPAEYLAQRLHRTNQALGSPLREEYVNQLARQHAGAPPDPDLRRRIHQSYTSARRRRLAKRNTPEARLAMTLEDSVIPPRVD